MNQAGRNVVAIDLGGTKIAAGLVVYPPEADPSILFTRTAATQTDRGGAHAMQTIVDLVGAVIGDAGEAYPIAGIGAGVVGCIDPENGTVVDDTGIMDGWRGMPLRQNLSDAFGVPACVVNDAQAHALGEARWGAAKGTASCLLVAPGTGLGGGIVIDGKLVRGAHGIAGHIGHTLHPAAAGLTCKCGANGHVESVTAGPGIGALYQGVSQSSARFDPAIDGLEVSRLAAAGEAMAQQTLHDAGFALGQAMGSWANMIDPEIIVLSGSVCNAGPLWRAGVDEGYADQALEMMRAVPIANASLGSAAPLIGAAEALLDFLHE